MLPNDTSATDIVTRKTSTSDEDISHPGQIDYLKIRVYLYKFTPEIFYGGKSTNSFANDLANKNAAQSVIDRGASTRAILQVIKDDLNAVDFTKNFSDFRVAATTTRAARSLERLLNMPSLSADFRLKLFDNNAGALTQNNYSLWNESEYTNAKALLDVLNQKTEGLSSETFFSSRRRNFIKYRDDTSNFIGRSLSIMDVTLSNATLAQKKIVATYGKQYASVGQFQVSRFVHDMNVKDLSRFDLSRYVSAYQVDQQLGRLSPGSIAASAVLQDGVIPLVDLTPIPGPQAVRRPIFFPNSKGDYEGYENGLPDVSAQRILGDFTKDPLTKEPISTLQPNDLIRRIAMAQTLEDNGGKEVVKRYSSAFAADVDRIELAIRVRGITNPRKKELILNYFRTGIVDDELVKMVTKSKARKNSGGVATDALVQNGITPLGLSSGLNEGERSVAKKLQLATTGDTAAQLQQMKEVLTDPAVDGLLVSDLIQKYDFCSIFIYKHEISPDVVESTLELNTGDPYFFDKESLFLYTPVAYLLDDKNEKRHVAVYSPEFNGFVLETGLSKSTGAVNSVSINFMGSMGLLGATQRIYSSSIFQNSIFDAAELADASQLSLYQNVFADKDPFQIFTFLLEGLYLLRVNIPSKKVEVSAERKQELNDEVRAKLVRSNVSADRIEILQKQAIKQEEIKIQSSQTKSGNDDYVRDSDGNVTSFLDILSLRAFNQFGETRKGVTKGPKHLFNMAAFLYANVMRGRRFNVRIPTAGQIDRLDISFGGRGAGTLTQPFNYDAITGQVRGAFNPYTSEGTLPVFKYSKEGDGSGGSILEINPSISTPSTSAGGKRNKSISATQAKQWKAYFLFLSQSFANFVADVKDGLDIMNDVLNSCYLELFETPGGRFILRTPQYNNEIPIYRTYSQDGQVKAQSNDKLVSDSTGTGISLQSSTSESASAAHMVTSEDIIPISTEYHQTAKGLVSKQQVTYAADLIGVPLEQLGKFYSNGKIVAQYGLTMGKAVVNPNVRNISKEKLQAANVDISDSTVAVGIFHYCRFFLEFANMHQFSASITAVGDPKIQVGRTYFDVANQKFGYITQVTKSLSVGQEYVMTFQLNAVRDAVYGEKIDESEGVARPVFRRLPEMEDFIAQFTGNTTPVVNVSSTQTAEPAPTELFSVWISDGGRFLTENASTAVLGGRVIPTIQK